MRVSKRNPSARHRRIRLRDVDQAALRNSLRNSRSGRSFTMTPKALMRLLPYGLVRELRVDHGVGDLQRGAHLIDQVDRCDTTFWHDDCRDAASSLS